MDAEISAGNLSRSRDLEDLGDNRSSVRTPPDRRLAVLIIAAAMIPILISGGIYFVDTPNHLFRAVLWQMLPSEGMGKFFESGTSLYPNLAIDVFSGLAGKVLPSSLAMTLYICLAIAAYISAAVWCRHARGEKTDAALLLIILLAVYSEPLYWGLFNYILGLGVMFVALHRATEQYKTRRTGWFALSQAVVVGALCLISIFPVMLYICFCLGMLLVAFHDDWRAHRFADTAGMIRAHWLSAVVVIGLLMVMEPGQSGRTDWHLITKITGIFSIGKTTNLPLEYLLSALALSILGWLAWRRGMTASRAEAAGLFACCLLFLAMPKDLMSVGAADRRLVPAIVTMAAIFVRGPSRRTAGSDKVATALLAGIVIAKCGLLLYLWAPLRQLDAAYAKIATQIPPDAIVFFVPPVEELRPGAVKRTKRFLELVSAFQRVPPADAHLFVEHPHLLLNNLIGRDVLPAQVFTNFWAKRTPEFSDLPDPAKSQTAADAAEALAQIPPSLSSYVISHIELDELLGSGSSHKIGDIDGIKLYVKCGAPC